MKMGFYTINLGTQKGQKLHMLHLVILPLIPVFILLIQNGTVYSANNDLLASLGYFLSVTHHILIVFDSKSVTQFKFLVENLKNM